MHGKSAARAGVALLLCTACAEPDVGTLVRFQGGKPSAPWNLQTASDAAADSGGEVVADSGRPDAGPADQEDAGDDATQANTVTACTFRLTTRAQGGRYAPKNIGAVWIAREDGTWVKTLALWAGVRLRYLTTYLKANSGRDTTDATTSATLRQHEAHELKWNLRDGANELVPDGNYRVQVEVTDRPGNGQLLSVPFSKSNEALKISIDDSEFFVDVELSCS